MTNHRRYSRPLARALNAFAFAALALLFLVLLDFSSDGAFAQRRGSRDYRDTREESSPPPVQVEAPRPVRTAAPQIDPASPFGTALASCDKDHDEDSQFSLPGLKGEVKLDRCYRGRKQLVCRFDAVVAEGKSLTDEFTRIVQERYPDAANLDEICKLDFNALIKDSGGATEFTKRFAAAKSEYEARTSCANKVKQSIQDVALPDLMQAPEVIKSLVDAVDQEIGRVSVVQDQVSGLATKIDSSQKAILVLQKIHRAMCMRSKSDAPADQGRVSNSM